MTANKCPVILPVQNLPGDEHGCPSSTYEDCSSIYLVSGEVHILLLPEEYPKAASPTYKLRFPKTFYNRKHACLTNTRGEVPSFWALFTIRRRGCVREVYCSSMCWRINPSRLVPVNALSLMKETCKKFKI